LLSREGLVLDAALVGGAAKGRALHRPLAPA